MGSNPAAWKPQGDHRCGETGDKEVRECGSRFRASSFSTAALLTLGVVLSASPACAQAPTNASSDAPLQENMPHSWFRNYDYGVQLDGKVLGEAGLYQMIGKPFMLIYGSAPEHPHLWAGEPPALPAIPRGGGPH